MQKHVVNFFLFEIKLVLKSGEFILQNIVNQKDNRTAQFICNTSTKHRRVLCCTRSVKETEHEQIDINRIKCHHLYFDIKQLT